MEKGRNIYMVVEWNAESGRYREERLFYSEAKAEWWKRNCEKNAESNAEFYHRECKQYFFISTMPESLVRLMKRQKYERLVAEGREYFMSQYRGELRPVCDQLLGSLACQIEACTQTELSMLERTSGILATTKATYMPGVLIWLEAMFWSSGEVWLSCVLNDGLIKPRKSLIKRLASWYALQQWAMKERDEAISECEQHFIDTIADQHQAVLEMPKE